MKYDVIVLGSGPGGYVTAIRASQLGLKTAVVEREALGGICLNWGCIPTKALLKSANVFEYIEHAEDYGISVAKPKADFGGMVKRSRGVADGMSKGVQFLMKKNKIDVIMGNGKLLPGKQLELVQLIRQLNKPVVVIVLSGMAVGMDFIAAQQDWPLLVPGYGGRFGPKAISEALSN